MPKYKVNKLSLIGNQMVEAGTVVEYDGHPGTNLDPMDKEGEKRKADYAEMRRPRTAEERMGEAVGNAIANPKAKKASKVDVDDTPTIVDPAAGKLTTEGSTSVPQKSAGGIDAENVKTST